MGTTTGAVEPDDDNSVELEELRDRVPWLIALRWTAIAGVVVTVWIVDRFFQVTLWTRPLYTIAAGLAAYNLIFWAVGRWVPAATRGSAVAYFSISQIALDLLSLTALLHYSGGIENPFLCYYVFHIVIASILLSRRATWLQAALAIGLIVSMAMSEALGIIPHHHLKGFLDERMYRSPAFVAGTLFAVGTMLGFTAFMATSITSRLRRREREIILLSEALREHAEDLNEAYEALRRIEGARTDYLHRVAHHIRSPLATLERMLAVITEGRTGSIPDRPQEMLERARTRIREVMDLARDLLILSRTQEAIPLVNRDKVDFTALVREVEGRFQEAASSAGVSVVSHYPSHSLKVIGDPEGLDQLVDNLFSNAIKYSPAGGEVSLRLERWGNEAVLSVSDHGIGIPEAEQEQIFSEFYRASNARESGKEGTGLGLSIVKAIVGAHNGALSIDSEVGRGTTFRITLPCTSA